MADKRISQLVERTDIANNDVVPIVASGATTTNKATISSIQEFMQENLDLGVTSVGITLGTTGTDVSVSGSPITTSGNITINIPSASATARGLVTTGTQTFAGAKTFSSDLNINEVNVGRGGGNLTNNTRVGLAALNANTTGQQNTALGTQSLLLSTTGSFNTGLGYNALLTNTVGAANTAVGSQALVLNTTGTSNTSIGNGAGRNNTTGDNNSFLGSLSGADNTTGSSNVAVGLTALSRNITGGQNTAIGRDAGRWIADGVTNNTNTNSSIYIGFFSKANADNQSNQIVIGHNATGQGSNTVTIGNSDITSNKLFGRVIHADAVNADESATLGQVNTSLDGYVTLNTAQTINGFKTFSNTIFATNGITASNPITISSSGNSDSLEVNHSSGSGIALDISKGGNGEGLRVAKTSGSGNAVTITGGLLSAQAATLTGALNGTSATFSGVINGQQGVFRNSGVPGIQVIRDLNVVSVGPAGQGIEFGALNGSTPTAGAAIYGGLENPATTGNLVFQTLTGGTLTTKLTLASTGAATFSSTVRVGGASGGDSLVTTANAGTNAASFSFVNTGGTSYIGAESSSGGTLVTGSTGYDLIVRGPSGITFSANNGASPNLRIASTGAATFSSSVTAASPGNSANSIVGNYSGGSQMMQFFQKPDGSNMELNLRNSSGTAVVRIDTSGNSWFNGGNVGIGTDSPDQLLQVAGNISLGRFNVGSSRYVGLTNGGGGFGDSSGSHIEFTSSSSTNGINFYTYNGTTYSEKMRITSGGQVQIIGANGAATTQIKSTSGMIQIYPYFGTYSGPIIQALDGAGADYIPLRIESSSVTFTSLGTGTVTATGGTLSTVSDSSFKIDDGFIDSALDKVLKLKPRYFYWNEKSGLPTDIRQLGFYAQEVNESIGEEAANTPADETIPWGITDRSIIAMLTKAIQELKTEIDSLKNQINQL
jgi:hypothetical protein